MQPQKVTALDGHVEVGDGIGRQEPGSLSAR